VNHLKFKTIYDLLEDEYKEKNILLEYFSEISTFIHKALRENPIKSINKGEDPTGLKVSKEFKTEEKIYSEINKFVKDKLAEYRLKNASNKDRKLFEILNSLANQQQTQNVNQSHADINNMVVSNILTKSLGKKEFNSSNLLLHSNNSLKNNYLLNNENVNNKSVTMSKSNFHISQPILNQGHGHSYGVPLKTADRYTEERELNDPKNEIQEDELNMKRIREITLNPYNLLLTNEIINKLDDSCRSLIYVLNDFLINERNRLEKEELQVWKEKKSYDSLKQAVGNSTEFDQFKGVSAANSFLGKNYNLINCIQILDEDREKIKSKMNKIDTKKKVYVQIANYSEEVFNYIKKEAQTSKIDNEIVHEKLSTLKKMIDEFSRIEENYVETNRFSARINREINNMQTNLKYNSNFLNLANTNNINNTFTNFFSTYDRKNIHKDFVSPYSHHFFNYKRSRYELDTKLDLLKSRISNSSFYGGTLNTGNFTNFSIHY
jgi:hypothetical protein